MSAGIGMTLEEAQAIAQSLVERMAPCCERIEVAGSIRRRKESVSDVELVVVPCWEERADPGDLLGERTLRVNLLHEWAMNSSIRWIKPGTSEIVTWQPKPDGRYWRALLTTEPVCKLDLFLTSAERFGITYLVRTGSAEFSHTVATHALRIGRPLRDGALTIAGVPVETPNEAAVFELLGLRHVAPEHRTGSDAVVVMPHETAVAS